MNIKAIRSGLKLVFYWEDGTLVQDKIDAIEVNGKTLNPDTLLLVGTACKVIIGEDEYDCEVLSSLGGTFTEGTLKAVVQDDHLVFYNADGTLLEDKVSAIKVDDKTLNPNDMLLVGTSCVLVINGVEYDCEVVSEFGAGGGSGEGTKVVANPTLEGTEDPLTGLQVEDTKYKVPDNYWTKYSSYGYSNFVPTYNARFFIEEGSGNDNYGTIWLGEFFTQKSSNVLYIQMARNATYQNGFMSLYHVLELNFGTNALAKIVLPGSQEGTAGQVLGKDDTNHLAWINPSIQLYRLNMILRVKDENNNEIGRASVVFLSTTTLTAPTENNFSSHRSFIYENNGKQMSIVGLITIDNVEYPIYSVTATATKIFFGYLINNIEESFEISSTNFLGAVSYVNTL